RADLRRLQRDRQSSSRQLVAATDSGVSAATARESSELSGLSPSKYKRLPLVGGAVLVAILAAALGGFQIGRRSDTRPVPTFHELTFRRGALTSARFAPDPRSAI